MTSADRLAIFRRAMIDLDDVGAALDVVVGVELAEVSRTKTARSQEDDVRLVAAAMGLRAGFLRQRLGTTAENRKRYVACRVLRTLGYSLPEIGRMLNCDHTTVLHRVRVADSDEQLTARVREIEARLGLDTKREAA